MHFSLSVSSSDPPAITVTSSRPFGERLDHALWSATYTSSTPPWPSVKQLAAQESSILVLWTAQGTRLHLLTAILHLPNVEITAECGYTVL
ncbi:hypothetical protein AZE42_11801 [Rhizopogon vesiculosus]|uniref:Uncharacterized protein n=1 Tax=Rhizopogon vesiculosus TaxID=180088 RepID=A0A1J8QEF2_9AGAM|nr:hypothetical protein AZE42_11801 [Rhizopogon vesiculosus]